VVLSSCCAHLGIWVCRLYCNIRKSSYWQLLLTQQYFQAFFAPTNAPCVNEAAPASQQGTDGAASEAQWWLRPQVSTQCALRG
jgi:hypothetical protein